MTLDDLRKTIDSLDERILKLLNERAQAGLEVGRIKQSTKAAYYVPEREKLVYEKLKKMNLGPLPDEAVKAIYREVMGSTRALEKPTTVALLGPRHTFSELAARRMFGAVAEMHPLNTLADVFTEVERGHFDYGLVPVESSMGGGVSDTLDRFMTSNLRIINEVLLHVTQNLLSKHPVEAITRIYSKDHAFFQSRAWLQANMPHAEHIHTSSTSEAARIASEEEGSAAIASTLAAEPYNLEVVAERIEDAPHNYTRFFVIANQDTKPTGKDKTSLLVSVKNRVGALEGLIAPLADKKIDMTRIESRPSRKKAWDYVFFIDIIGHEKDPDIGKALDEIAENCSELKVLGSYPQGDVEI
ncbi:MAG: prephenate dehydratase [Candidatus Hydrogenedentes bacterium]|nr:prephenate dehydratase [Candidatus Hydrogenedentota bacterium]